MEQPRARPAAHGAVRGGDHRPPTGGGTFRETGDRHREGQAWNNLGLALRHMGQFEEAVTADERGIAICAELADHYGQAQTLANLGNVHADLGNPQRARLAWADAADLYAAVGAEDDAARIRRRIVDLDP